ncbi:hypothetical protein [Helicobacter labetoulli]
MRVVHVLGILILAVNAYFFTDNIIGQIVQAVLVLALIIHDVDENKWGVNMTKLIINELKTMTLNSNLKVDTSFSLENAKVLSLIARFKDEIKNITDIIE